LKDAVMIISWDLLSSSGQRVFHGNLGLSGLFQQLRLLLFLFCLHKLACFSFHFHFDSLLVWEFAECFSTRVR